MPLSMGNNPTSIFIRTDFPEPERPSTAIFSPLTTSRLMSFNTSRSPNDLYNPLIEMTTSLSAMLSCFSIVLKIPYPTCDLNYKYFFNKYEEHGENHSLVGSFPYSLCPVQSVISFVTSH